MRRVAIMVIGLLAGGAIVAAAHGGGAVSLNGTVVPRATSMINSTVDLTPFRDGTEPCARLIAGCKHYAVCISAPAPIAALDAALPQAATPSFFSVGVEDGRQFSQCLLSSLMTSDKGDDGWKAVYKYCLQCLDVTTPP